MRIPIAVALVATTGVALAHHHEFIPPSSFSLGRPGLGGPTPARAVPAYAASSRIAVLAGRDLCPAGRAAEGRCGSNDDGALVIDADSGWLVRTDAAGAPLAHVAIGSDAGLLAYDPVAHRAYVADRTGDRIAVVDVGATLAIRASWHTPAEPYGVALTPDRTLALVTTIADRTLVAYDTASGREQWRVALDAEPRGVAISGDGAHAVVTSLALGGLDRVELATHHLVRAAYAGASFARGAFAATYLGDHLVAAPLELEFPNQPGPDGAVEDHYGGAIDPPLSHALAFVDDRGPTATATTNVNEPRAVAWDAPHDLVYIAGLATDTIVQVARASQIDPRAGLTGSLGTRCGADGLAVAADGSVLVWCSFSRTIVRVAPAPHALVTTSGPEIAATALDPVRHQGLVLFHTANADVSAFAGLSCGNCHIDGRSDGQSWLIHGAELQTPILAGRIANTAPYKWDGTAKDLVSSLRQTIERLGGDGLSKKHLAALAAYVTGMPAVRVPTRDPEAVARGQALFESAELGCTMCHDAPAYTDRERHTLGKHKPAFDTPSLVGLAASAPYFHDGSAPTLEALLRDRGGVHGMTTPTERLDDAQIADLTAFLETR